MGHNPVSKYWKVPTLWPGSEVVIIGGGPSLKGFDYSVLKGYRVIGCNDAYKLVFPQFYNDPSLIDLCYWGDYGWWLIHWNDTVEYPEKSNEASHPGLIHFPGLRVTCSERYVKENGVLCLKRQSSKLSYGSTIGWFHNTGASAVNLAVNLGAKKVILLGFDMKLDDKTGKQNWHHNLKNDPNAIIIERHKKHINNALAPQINQNHPDVEIINACPESTLDCWKKMKPEDIF